MTWIDAIVLGVWFVGWVACLKPVHSWLLTEMSSTADRYQDKTGIVGWGATAAVLSAIWPFFAALVLAAGVACVPFYLSYYAHTGELYSLDRHLNKLKGRAKDQERARDEKARIAADFEERRKKALGYK